MSSDLPTFASRPRTVGLHSNAKSLIRNIMRHTDTHNRMLEESEMWQMYYRMNDTNPSDGAPGKEDDKRSSGKDESKDEKTEKNRMMDFKDPDIHKSFLYDERRDLRYEETLKRGTKRAHMDDISDEERRRKTAVSNDSTFWMRQLQKTEEGDNDRWGHAGFKELYPDDFDSDRSTSYDASKRLKRREHSYRSSSHRRHKHRSSSSKRRRGKHRSEHEHTRERIKRQKSRRDDRRRERKRRKKRKKSVDESDSDDSVRSSRGDRVTEDVNSSPDSEADSEDESRRKRGRRNMKTASEREKDLARETTENKYLKRKKRRRKH